MIERIILPRRLKDRIAAEARTAFPRECCGLLEGRVRDQTGTVMNIHPARNLATESDQFEIDPADQIAVLRRLRGTDRDVIGCYHSHPNGRAGLSARDREHGSGDDFAWVILGLVESGATGWSAHAVHDGTWHNVELRTDAMQLIFLHGPPAAGKLTIGRELARITNLPLFHNHLVVDAASALFPFGTPAFVRLREEMWLAAFREAAMAGQSLIFTFAPERTVRPEFPANAVSVIEGLGGHVVFVRLECSEAEIERRLGEPSRATFGKLGSATQYRTLKSAGAFEVPPLPAQVSLDTTWRSPSEAADEIAAYLATLA